MSPIDAHDDYNNARLPQAGMAVIYCWRETLGG